MTIFSSLPSLINPPALIVDSPANEFLAETGYTCALPKDSIIGIYECKPCSYGTYKTEEACTPCPPGKTLTYCLFNFFQWRPHPLILGKKRRNHLRPAGQVNQDRTHPPPSPPPPPLKVWIRHCFQFHVSPKTKFGGRERIAYTLFDGLQITRVDILQLRL